MALRFNRTLMELKHSGLMSAEQADDRFNRTLMELKPVSTSASGAMTPVLIVPLWN